MSHASTTRTRIDPVNNQYYWSVVDDGPRIQDYTLNTSPGTGLPGRRSESKPPCRRSIRFTGQKPNPGENYRVALARIVTSDIQFSRAAVNYLWKEFFGRGIVEPVNQFDPARLDPDNPPADPWTLQP